MVQFIPADILAVDLLAGVLALTEGPDVEIVVQDALHRHDGPGGFDGAVIVLPCGQLALLFRHAGGGDALIRELIGNFFVAPAVDVQLENSPDDLRLGGDYLELLLVDNVTIGCGTDPFAVLLAALDDRFHLLAGGGVIPVQLLVHGDMAVAGDVKTFNHQSHLSNTLPSDGRTLKHTPRLASCGTRHRCRPPS